ncbi:hypothetical protein P3551_23080 [Vibrio parahaemolyticus]|nr:hypothetical protein [Vibrio parahaemolyticus]
MQQMTCAFVLVWSATPSSWALYPHAPPCLLAKTYLNHALTPHGHAALFAR